MKLHTLWKMWDDGGVELVFALDEYTAEQNWQAWQDGVTAACKRYGITPADLREVVISVPEQPIIDAFRATEVAGQIIPPSATGEQ